MRQLESIQSKTVRNLSFKKHIYSLQPTPFFRMLDLRTINTSAIVQKTCYDVVMKSHVQVKVVYITILPPYNIFPSLII